MLWRECDTPFAVRTGNELAHSVRLSTLLRVCSAKTGIVEICRAGCCVTYEWSYILPGCAWCKCRRLSETALTSLVACIELAAGLSELAFHVAYLGSHSLHSTAAKSRSSDLMVTEP